MGWMNNNRDTIGGACLNSLAMREPRKNIYYPLRRALGVDAVRLYEDFAPHIPKRISNKLSEWGFQIEVTDYLCYQQEGAKGVNISHEEFLQDLSVKKLHWAVNIHRYHSERAKNYQILATLKETFNLDITPFEMYLLTHSLYAEFGHTVVNGVKSIQYIYAMCPTDQTMLNGYSVANNLNTILSRLYDIDRKDFTEPLSTGKFVYWSDIPDRKYVSRKSGEAFTKLLTFPTINLSTSSQEQQLQRHALDWQDAAHILRKYLNKWERN